jgi:carbamoyl-phosphate synthase large subunit
LNELCPVRQELAAFFSSPPAAQEAAFLAFLGRVLDAERLEFLFPVSEAEIAVVSRHRAMFEQAGVKLVMNNETVIETFLDKLETARFMRRLGVRAPATALLSEYDGSLGFPLIVKPRRGCGSRRLWTAEDAADLEYLRRKDDGSLIVQEMVGDEREEYTTGVFSDGLKVSSISFRRKLGYGGLSREATLVADPGLEALSSAIARAVGLVGSINVQTRRSGGLFVPFEVNPRVSSTVLFRKRFGFDDASWWIDVLSGKGYSYEPKYSRGTAVRCVSECYFDMEES